jgi:hypothetical protein
MKRGLPASDWTGLSAEQLEDLNVEAEPPAEGFRMFIDGVDVQPADPRGGGERQRVRHGQGARRE